MIEPAFDDPGIAEEIDAVDAAAGGGGEFEAVALSFFATDDDIFDPKKPEDSVLVGKLTLINQKLSGAPNYTLTYVYEAIFRRPQLQDSGAISTYLLNHYSFSSNTFKVSVSGVDHDIDGFYYCQQNVSTYRCAQACLRMALNTVAGDGSQFSPSRVNKLSGVTDPSQGLTLQQLIDVIDNSGLSIEAKIIPCQTLETEKFISNIAGFVESGITVLIVFNTASDQHVVSCFGYTQNTDEWHPQALPAYSGPASSQYFASSLWTDHLLIHDDNFGPYFTLNSRALSMDKNVKPEWIIALTPVKVNMTPVGAQAIAAITMSQTIRGLLGRGQWFTFIKNGNSLVFRPTFLNREEYLAHLATQGHDGSQLTPNEIGLLKGIPDNFWMVEFATPPLFTGNHSKLGEVIIDNKEFDISNIYGPVVAIRLPSLILLAQPSQFPQLQYQFHHVGMSSHMPILDVGDHGHRW